MLQDAADGENRRRRVEAAFRPGALQAALMRINDLPRSEGIGAGDEEEETVQAQAGRAWISPSRRT
ncbi:MAG: hypothetical protein D6788_11290 [Planctomycetota bacterium]|nr:MAG: hypothetical protein D6788_11290 [Planctomycetota bacterium]